VSVHRGLDVALFGHVGMALSPKAMISAATTLAPRSLTVIEAGMANP
jgi:hypothetical protein